MPLHRERWDEVHMFLNLISFISTCDASQGSNQGHPGLKIPEYDLAGLHVLDWENSAGTRTWLETSVSLSIKSCYPNEPLPQGS